MKDNNDFKSGFVSIVGMANVGKSTLLNRIAGQKIAIISDKPQTTRNKVLAIYTTEEEQIIFTDTPGIHKPRTKLGETMVKTANKSMNETDVIVFVADASTGIQPLEESIAKSISESGAPCILVLNKIDTIRKDMLLPMIADYSNLCNFEAIVPISAKTGDGMEVLMNNIRQYIKPGPRYYYDDIVTDQPEKQIAAEIIREKMLWLLDKEIPHGIVIEIDYMKELPKITEITASIYCEKLSHKGIIIGKGGEMLKRIGSMARGDIEKMLGKQIYLQLWVKVKTDWRNNNNLIRNFGFEQ